MATTLLILILIIIAKLTTSSSASSSSSSLSSNSMITPNQSLSGTQTLVSDGGKFAMGFFKPGKPSYYYIGIWYNQISTKTPVWVASRDTPITDPNTSHFKISSDDGNLVLSNQTNPKIWSTDANIITSSNKSSTTNIAVLLDTGNLVLRDGSNPNITLWQSIDHPTHTWLPGGKLEFNKLTGKTQHLTSWKSSDDPSTGIYHLELDPNGTSQYYLVWNNSTIYWSSGLWNNINFDNVPEMTANYNYDFSYVSNATENYFTYSVKSQSLVSRFLMDVSGQVQQQTWVDSSQEWFLFWSEPKQQCQVYSFCGSFGVCNQNAQPYCNCLKGFSEKSPTDWDLGDRTGGCTRNTPLRCERQLNGSTSKAKVEEEEDKFWTMSDAGLPDQAQTVVHVGSDSDCKEACLANCSCTAYAYNSSGCFVWLGELLNLQQQVSSGGGTLFLRLAASEIESPKSNKGIIMGAVIGGVVGCLLFLLLLWGLIWWKRRGMGGKSKTVEGGLVAFTYSDLQRATKNFSEKLGGGGFGSVFKGVLPDSTSTVIAAKRLEGLRQGEKQFRSEVSTIGTTQHVNLVRLHGFCSQGSQKILVYEYMPNGSLDFHLFFQSSSSSTSSTAADHQVLKWKTRYQIALGTARGLTYLHEQCRDCIIHCDIKPENILLDAYFVPKLADFGLAKLMGRDFSRVLTTMRGTRGYLAPEWISGLAITAKADVYSYGMMLFEIISGKRNSDHAGEEKNGFFPTLAGRKLVEGDVVGLLDRRLEGDANLEEVTRACKVACWCIQDDEDCRPSMGQVVQILEGVVEVGIPPIPRALQLLADNNNNPAAAAGNIVFFSELSSTTSSLQTAGSSRTTAAGSGQTKSSSSTIEYF